MLAQIAGGSLEPADIARFATPLLVPPAMPTRRHARGRWRQRIDYYEIGVRQFSQQVLPVGMPRHHGLGLWALVATENDAQRSSTRHH